MSFEIDYFHERVQRDIESWPVDVLADYARYSLSMAQASGSRTRVLSVLACLSFGLAVVPA